MRKLLSQSGIAATNGGIWRHCVCRHCFSINNHSKLCSGLDFDNLCMDRRALIDWHCYSPFPLHFYDDCSKSISGANSRAILISRFVLQFLATYPGTASASVGPINVFFRFPRLRGSIATVNFRSNLARSSQHLMAAPAGSGMGA